MTALPANPTVLGERPWSNRTRYALRGPLAGSRARRHDGDADVVGQRLDAAQKRVEEFGYAHEEVAGGFFEVLEEATVGDQLDRNWTVPSSLTAALERHK